MGSQPLSDRNLRRIERQTGLALVRAVAHGGHHWLSIVTADHRHGHYDPASGAITWDDNPIHFTSCEKFFPDYRRNA